MKKKYLIFVLVIINVIIFITALNRINILSNRYYGAENSKYQTINTCIFVVNRVIIKEIESISNFLNNNTISSCKSLYALIPAIGDVREDLHKKSLYIIRYLYPNPLEYALLMPMYLEVNECAIFNIKQSDIQKIDENIKEFFNNACKVKMNITDVIDSYIIKTEHIRYVCLYKGPLHFRENLYLILKDTYSFSYYYYQYPLDKSISYSTCIKSDVNNNEVGVVLRLRRRNNMNISIESFLKFENFTTLVLAQNEQYFDFRWVFLNSEYNSSINKMYLFWCTNWNSVFYLFRLIPLLLNTEFTIVIDDDFTVKPGLIKLGKYLANKEKIILSPAGWNPYEKSNFIINNITYHLSFSNTIYSGQVLRSEWYVYLYRLKIPYKLWGDEVSTALSTRIICGHRLAIINGYMDFMPQVFCYGATNSSNYKRGPRYVYPFMKKCKKFKNDSKLINKCFFKIPK